MDQSFEIITPGDSVAADNGDIVMLSRDDVSDFNEENILPQTPETLIKIKQWLCPTDYAAVNGEFYKHLSSHVAGTGDWLYLTDAYKQWHDSEAEGILWLKGIPGSGKSVFAARSIQRLQEEGAPILYFFFRQIIRANYEPTALLRDWLVQILPYSPPLQARLKEYLDERRKIETLSITDMFRDLRLACTYVPKVYCVIDALDEMNLGNDQFLHELAKFASWQPPKMRMIITSRPVPAVETPLRPYPTIQIRLQEQLVDQDIAVYVQRLLASSRIPKDDQNKIQQAVLEKAGGIFLYAKLVMEQIMEQDANIEHILETLPANLNVMYTTLLKEHSQRSGIPHHVQLLVLQWVTHANRPLRLLEMSEMLTVTRQLDGIRELKEVKDIIRAICGSLLEILPDETVSVVHHSLTEFLKGQTRSLAQGHLANEYSLLESESTHLRLALACLSYLDAGCLDSYEIMERSKMRNERWKTRRLNQDSRLEHPFAEYAVFNWHIHIIKAGISARGQPEVYKLLDNFLQGNRLLVWLSLEWPNCEFDDMSPLHVAAYLGLTDYMRELLERPNTNVNVINEMEETPIYWAAYNGHEEEVRLLLQHGAESNKYNATGLTPIHEAAMRNHAAATQVLLTAGVNPLTPRTDPQAKRYHYAERRSTGRTPLQYACKNGHKEVVAIYLPFLNDVNVVYNALHLAAECGQDKVVECILRHPGIEVDAFISHHTALYYACEAVNPQTIEVLLKAGANPNVLLEPKFYQDLSIRHGAKGLDPNGSQRMLTALHVLSTSAAGNNRPSVERIQKCFELVQEVGVDLEVPDLEGKTALHSLFSGSAFVSSESVFAMLRLLVKAGADVNTTCDKGDTPLHGNLTSKDAVRLLIEEGGADINKRRTSDGRTPLLCLLSSQSPETSLEFLSFGPDCNTVDNNGNGTLHVAVGCKHTNRDLILALLARGADPNMKNHSGQTALHIEGEHGQKQEDLIKVLVESGADLEARDNKGFTPLFQRVSANYYDRDWTMKNILKTFVELGAKTDCRDDKGRTLLHEAAHRDAYDRVKYFLDLGVSPLAQDEAGNTMWHEAIYTRSYPAQRPSWHGSPVPDIYNLLTESGVDPDQANNQGRTPLHIACSIETEAFDSHHEKTPIDYLLSVCKNPSPADSDGITPLHLAATISEYHVAALLRAGANVAAVTLEGLTPLHLAARACQSNIVGMLLDEVEKDGSSNVSTLVNCQDNSGRTALHYACRSGRPEAVAFLLASAADVNMRAKDGMTPLQECTKFESELELWRGCGSAGDRQNRLQAAGLKLNDETRPFLRKLNQPMREDKGIPPEHTSSRLDEILDMLVAHGLDVHTTDTSGRNQIQEAISLIKSPTMGYTIRCFLDLVNRLDPKLYKSDIESLSSLREQAEAMAVPQEPDHQCNHIHCHDSEPDKLLMSREYSRVEEIHREGTDFTQASRGNGTPWHSLVLRGYGRLLEKLCSHEVVKNFESQKWCQKWVKISEKRSRPYASLNISSLLIAACSSRIPNMEVVKVLVETFKANVNAQTSTQIFNLVDGQIVEGETALHILARGHHWWQVHQALPYLVSHGANVNLKDQIKRTPLHIALETIPGNSPRVPSFQEEAARILVNAGADIHASDRGGKSCQTLAVRHSNPRMLQIILPPGTALDISILFVAIEECNDQLFERLMSVGLDLNKRCNANASGDKLGPIKRDGGATIELDELYALLLVDHKATHASAPNSGPFFGSGFGNNMANPAKPDDRTKYIRMMELLVSHGVDIYSRFNKTIQDTNASPAAMASTNETINSSENGGPGKQPPQGHHYEDCTVIHELLESSRYIQDIIDWKSLDLEHRDGKGRTLLMAACRNKTFADVTATKLVELGADVSARDSEGKNALHHIFESHAPNEMGKHNEVVKLMLSKRPELIHEEDTKGNLPINYVQPGFCNPPLGVFRPGPYQDIVEILLDAGSDPLHPDADGNFPIHFLGHRPKYALFQRFLDMGVPIDIRNTKNGNTPLFNWFSSEPSNLDWPRVGLQGSHFGVFNAGFSSTAFLRPHPSTVYPFPTAVLPGTATATPSVGFPNTNFQRPFLAQPVLASTGLPAVPQQPVDRTKLEDFEQEQLAFYEKAGADFMVRNNAGETLLHTLASSSFQGRHGGRSKDDITVARFKFLVAKGLDPLAEDGRQRTAIDVAVACDNKGFLDFFKK
ncbi:Ankyrin repeat protein [Trichoderma simmonsii]|uniref:Ankyrin repeat protein n=1 Tax=Trichoderma simmonsii TaxID=1491479 RepID=A0A8G0PG06_9HYPO|nr:Ankyrin repeat protein [Trichoderma simmonsii]